MESDLGKLVYATGSLEVGGRARRSAIVADGQRHGHGISECGQIHSGPLRLNRIGVRALRSDAQFQRRAIDHAFVCENPLRTRLERSRRNGHRVRPHLQRHGLTGRVNGCGSGT